MSVVEKKSIKEVAYEIFSKAGVKFFYKIFPEYFAKQPLKPTDRYVEYPFVVRNLPPLPARVLDVGCAGSFFPLILAGFGYDVYAIDVREYAILNAMRIAHFTFSKEDIRKTSYPDNFFDSVFAVSTIEHIGLSGRYGMNEDSVGDQTALNEMARILKASGCIVLTVPFGKARVVRPHHRIYDKSKIMQLVGKLKIDNEEYYLRNPQGDWQSCSQEQASLMDNPLEPAALCLLKLRKLL